MALILCGHVLAARDALPAQVAQLPPRGADRLPAPGPDQLPAYRGDHLPRRSVIELPPRVGRAANPAAITRTVIAATTLPDVADVPLYFRVLSVTLSPGAKSVASAANGILYMLSGSLHVAIGDDGKTLHVGDGMVAPAGRAATLTAAGNAPATFLHFLLLPADVLDLPVETAPAIANELYRTSAPLRHLKPEPYVLDLTRVSFPIDTPADAPHHRTGAALDYIVGGTGAITTGGTTTDERPGALVYQPFGLVHQWANPHGEPLIFVVFNINPAGIGAVRSGAPSADE